MAAAANLQIHAYGPLRSPSFRTAAKQARLTSARPAFSLTPVSPLASLHALHSR